MIDPKMWHNDFTSILERFKAHYGISNGILQFQRFVENNDLDPSKPYNPLIQWQESFQWTEPLLKYLRQDKSGAKFYHCLALSVCTTINNHSYPAEKLSASSPSMGFRPLNINHNHSRWLSFPANSTVMAKFYPCNSTKINLQI